MNVYTVGEIGVGGQRVSSHSGAVCRPSAKEQYIQLTTMWERKSPWERRYY